MNPDKKKSPTDKEPSKSKKDVDLVETPPPPQHMDPSKKPAEDKKKSKK